MVLANDYIETKVLVIVKYYVYDIYRLQQPHYLNNA